MMDDRELAHTAARGNQQAFETLVERYRGLIYSTAWKVLLHEDDALDVSQEVLIRLSRKIGSYDGRGTLASWIRTITVRAALDHRRRPREISIDDEEWAELPDESPDPFATLERSRRMILVEKAAMELSPQQRSILLLRLKEEVTFEEISRQLGIQPAQVRSQFCRAVARLKEMLSEEKKK